MKQLQKQLLRQEMQLKEQLLKEVLLQKKEARQLPNLIHQKLPARAGSFWL